MKENFKNFIKKTNLFAPDERVLIAVSGGLDSVVLCHLFKMAGFDFGMAHCNFQLRGEASDGDAAFVKKLAQSLQVPFFETTFDTTAYMAEHKLSVQVAARDLRYEWLEKMRVENSFQYLATAHHLNDSVETVLYNFTKGCGIRGLHGILPKVNNLIRPLLFTGKKELLLFAKEQQIEFREDASNASDKYARNHIRHNVIPALEKINPALTKTVGENIERFRETEQLFNYAIVLLQKEICEQRGDQLFIHLEKLRTSPAPLTLLFEVLFPYGFNNDQVRQMVDAIDNQAGAIFIAPQHQLLLDREYFILKKNTAELSEPILIYENDTFKEFPQGKITLKKRSELPTSFTLEKNVVYFDLEKIKFPLLLRPWQAGDIFQPIGMNGKQKKVKALLTNLKLNRFEKEKIWVLESDGKICWVVGIRMDERFKISEETKEVIQVLGSGGF